MPRLPRQTLIRHWRKTYCPLFLHPLTSISPIAVSLELRFFVSHTDESPSDTRAASTDTSPAFCPPLPSVARTTLRALVPDHRDR